MRRLVDRFGSIAIPLAFVIAVVAASETGLKW